MVAVRGATLDSRPSAAWMVTRYEDVRALLDSPHTSTALDRGASAATQPGFLLTLDPPDHTRLRRLLTREFSARSIEAMRPRVREIVAGFLDDVEAAGPGADLMATFAAPVASQVICELLGVPFEDRAGFQRRSALLFDFDATPQEQGALAVETHRYMSTLVARHRADPDETVLGRLVRDHGEEVDDEELVGIGNILLIAGHETSSSTIGLGALLLIQHPEQLAVVRDDPSAAAGAAEEVLRYLSVAHTGSLRVATADITLGGTTIRAGDTVMVVLPSANRDTTELPDADRFDVRRPATGHLAFGHGIHQCLGQALARIELSEVFPALLNRFPGLRLAADASTLPFRGTGAVNSVGSLPVAW